MNIVIRKITVEDSVVVASLSLELGYHLSAPETAMQIQEILGSPGNCALVALYKEKVIGWIHAFKSARIETKTFIEIGGLVIDKNFRDKGVGSALVNKIKEWCTEQKIISLRVRCNTKRSEAHRFYGNLGFEESKEQKVFQQDVL